MNRNRKEEMQELALSLGLDPFPVVFETVEQSTMFEVCSYGLPIRARHWSYGRSFEHQKTYGEMGFSKVYEVIINNNPSYAFMLDTNTEVQNLFIVAHCLGHSDFFKNNYLFESTNRNMVSLAAEHAGRIDECIEKYGFEAVERIMDIGFALDNHIDWNKGIYRSPYPKKFIRTRKRKYTEFSDLLDNFSGPSMLEDVIGGNFPPHPEKDLLWLMINYAPLEDWERDILNSIREEAFYFYPQMMTKIMNEGWASYWHAELMYKYEGLTPEEYLDFLTDHEKVVQASGNPFRLNPYYLGFRIFKDIEKRWDEKHKKGESNITGRQKIFQVRKEEDDISFIRNYLTQELVDDLKLFTYGYQEDYPEDFEGEKLIEIKERIRDEVVEAIIKPLFNAGSPRIVVTGTNFEGGLILEHESEEMGTLDFKFAEKTLEYIWDLWAAPIELHTTNDEGERVRLCFDEAGFFIKTAEDDLDMIDLEPEEEKTDRFIITP